MSILLTTSCNCRLDQHIQVSLESVHPGSDHAQAQRAKAEAELLGAVDSELASKKVKAMSKQERKRRKAEALSAGMCCVPDTWE